MTRLADLAARLALGLLLTHGRVMLASFLAGIAVGWLGSAVLTPRVTP